MAKVQIKSEIITPFGGIFHVREQFSRNSRWDRYLGMTAAITQLPVPTATEIIDVVNVEGVNVEDLYLRAIESLNNWGKSSA